MKRTVGVLTTLVVLLAAGAACAAEAVSQAVSYTSVTLTLQSSDDATARFYAVRTVLPTNCQMVSIGSSGTCSYAAAADALAYDHVDLQLGLEPLVAVNCLRAAGSHTKNVGDGVRFEICRNDGYEFSRSLTKRVTFVIAGIGAAPNATVTAFIAEVLEHASYLGRRDRG